MKHKVALIILYDHEKNFLLQHRTRDAAVLPDYWAFFGGGIKKGETPEDGVRREAYEELNYKLAREGKHITRYFIFSNKTEYQNGIERLKKQEEELLSAYKEITNQWRGSLFIFAGLAMTALGNQHNAYAYSLIVLWLIEALFILSIFLLNRNVYNLMMDRHFEGTVSEEQEQRDIKYAEKKR